MCVNDLSKVALDSAVAGTEPANSNRKSNALNHCVTDPHCVNFDYTFM